MEVQLHVDVRMRQKAGTQTTKIKSAKSFVMVHPRKFIPSKYTRYTVPDIPNNRHCYIILYNLLGISMLKHVDLVFIKQTLNPSNTVENSCITLMRQSPNCPQNIVLHKTHPQNTNII